MAQLGPGGPEGRPEHRSHAGHRDGLEAEDGHLRRDQLGCRDRGRQRIRSRKGPPPVRLARSSPRRPARRARAGSRHRSRSSSPDRDAQLRARDHRKPPDRRGIGPAADRRAQVGDRLVQRAAARRGRARAGRRATRRPRPPPAGRRPSPRRTRSARRRGRRGPPARTRSRSARCPRAAGPSFARRSATLSASVGSGAVAAAEREPGREADDAARRPRRSRACGRSRGRPGGRGTSAARSGHDQSTATAVPVVAVEDGAGARRRCPPRGAPRTGRRCAGRRRSRRAAAASRRRG